MTQPTVSKGPGHARMADRYVGYQQPKCF